MLEDYARKYPFSYGSEEQPDLFRSIERQYLDPERQVDRWAHEFLARGVPIDTSELPAAMTYALKERFTYVAREESGTQDPIITLQLGSGSCRDFALLMMEGVRSLGLAARFVSGYLYVPDKDEPGRVGGGTTHVWLEVYLPSAGWAEFDPTDGIVGNPRSYPGCGGARPAPSGADIRQLDRLSVGFAGHECRGQRDVGRCGTAITKRRERGSLTRTNPTLPVPSSLQSARLAYWGAVAEC